MVLNSNQACFHQLVSVSTADHTMYTVIEALRQDPIMHFSSVMTFCYCIHTAGDMSFNRWHEVLHTHANWMMAAPYLQQRLNFGTLWHDCSWDSLVGTVTCYRLDSLGIKSQWLQDFPYLSRLALGSTQPPVQWVLGLSQG
jgi:hypothetical protein